MAPTPMKHDPQLVIDDLVVQFDLGPETLTGLTKAFLEEIREGLGKYGQPMAMIPTFVTGVPDGTEYGTFLALDLGGTNLRVCEVELHGDQTFSLRQQKYKVSEALKTGEATVLFDYLADSVDAFLTDAGSPTEENPGIPPSLANPMTPPLGSGPSTSIPDVVHLGLTFSFPVEQTALNSGKLLSWTKGFSAKNAIDKDIVKLLQDAFDRKHIHVKCVALVNDTVGAMLSRAYTAGGCILGAIFGTGTNGAYIEDISNITKLGNSVVVQPGSKMVVNTEWGAFNNKRTHLPSTIFDNKLDRESINSRYQAFEKFISGMYLGEITRNVLLSLIDAAPRPLLFNGLSTKSLNTHYGLDTAVMSAVETAWGKDPINTESQKMWTEGWEANLSPETSSRLKRVHKVVVEHLGYSEDAVTLRDAALVRHVCHLVARRAALLSGCAVSAIVVQTGRGKLNQSEGVEGLVDAGKRILVGVDGSLVEHYPSFEPMLRESLKMLVGAEVESRVEIGMAKDGSGVGAALCALQAAKQLQHPLKNEVPSPTDVKSPIPIKITQS